MVRRNERKNSRDSCQNNGCPSNIDKQKRSRPSWIVLSCIFPRSPLGYARFCPLLKLPEPQPPLISCVPLRWPEHPKDPTHQLSLSVAKPGNEGGQSIQRKHIKQTLAVDYQRGATGTFRENHAPIRSVPAYRTCKPYGLREWFSLSSLLCWYWSPCRGLC
jgi:hypothetical protein